MMQRKLSVVLVAAALELYAASLAHAACPADGATPFSTGPLNPVSGYAEHVTDSNGVSLQICKNADMCFFDPAVAGNFTSEQTGTGTESFWWLSDARIDVPATGFGIRLVMAAEATYNTETPAPDEQLSFTRLRIWIDAPRPGHYRVTHPYGETVYTIETVGDGFDSRETIDLSFTPGQSAAKGRVGPWLKWDPAVAPAAPAGYIGDGGTPHRVVGSPCNTNFLQVVATDFNGLPIDLTGAGLNVVRTDQFTVQGQLFDGRVQTPLAADRITYSRTPLRVGQVDAFAHSASAATVTLRDSAGTPQANARLTTDRTLASNGAGAFFTSEVLADLPNDTNLPKAVALTASVADGSTDTTTLVRPLVDQVIINQAVYDLSTGNLVVRAVSSDTRVAPTLTLQEYNVPANQTVTTKAPPGRVTVISSAGGWDSASVSVVPTLAPDAPTNLAAVVNSATQVSLTWSDNATGEAGYDVERNGTVIARLLPDTQAYTDTTAVQDTSYRYQVFANNAGGRAASNSVTVQTPVTLNAPSNLAAIDITPTSVTLTWADNSDNESTFEIRRNGVVVGTVAANVNTFADSGLATGSYTYQVVAIHPRATAASEILTVSTLINLAAPTNLVVNGGADNTSVRLNWTDNSTGETSYRVTRSTFAVAANGTVSQSEYLPTVNGALGANAVQAVEAGLALNTLYSFQVNAANGTTQGPAATVNRYTGTLPVPANLRSNVQAGLLLGIGGTPAGQVPLTWTASNVAAVAGYDIERCTGTTTQCGTAAATWSTVVRLNGRGTAAYTVTGLTSRQAYTFRIRTHTGIAGLNSAFSAGVAGTPR